LLEPFFANTALTTALSIASPQGIERRRDGRDKVIEFTNQFDKNLLNFINSLFLVIHF
jgi:hypothetical protein